MNLAKPHLDIGVYVRDVEPALRFWQDEVGAKFDHVLALGPGLRQHRHDLYGSVLKINNSREPRPDAPATGYVELLVARDDVAAPKTLKDPEGNQVTLVPPGTYGVAKIGVRLAVRDLAAHRDFYGKALGLTEEKVSGADMAFRAGDSVILVDRSDDAPADAQIGGFGWRYITFQIHKVDEEHAFALANGAGEGRSPVTLGETARISMIRDPDGNWIELSQRASITGSLEP
ncbi:MAG TPA: VOC family protein [Caulobacteraceae bacterium]|jgi:lactoylglutathione lyase|nr:VOC family protein [Caulobacteraceae bacterium]